MVAKSATAPSDRRPETPDVSTTRRRVQELREFATGVRVLPILTQEEPDPDALASALAVRVLLSRSEKSAPIVTLGSIVRPETRRMAELLGIKPTTVTAKEVRGYDRLIAVDLEPVVLRGAATRTAVIDHHPREKGYHAPFSDVRPEYGAAATILTEYLRADGIEVRQRLATALLYGIRTDTAVLTRGTHRADVEAYAYLQQHADSALLNRIDRPAYPREVIPLFGQALARVRFRDACAAVWMGQVAQEHAHMLPELADLSLSIEGVSWMAAGGVLDDALVVNLRHLDGAGGLDAGALARILTEEAGSGGGHASMARVEIPVGELPFEVPDAATATPPDADAADQVTNNLLGWICSGLARLREERTADAAASHSEAARRPAPQAS